MTAGICEVEIKNGKFSSGDSSSEILGGSVEVISEIEQVSPRTSEVEKLNGLENMLTDLDSMKIFNSKCSLIPTKSSQINEVEVPPFNFLIKVPRFEDEKLTRQIKSAQLQLDEKIRCRNAIGAEIQESRAILKAHYEAFKIANLEVRAAIKLRRSKMPEMESILSLIRLELAVEEANSTQKQNVEDMIKYLNRRKEIQIRLKNLEKEVDSLKDNESKVKATESVLIKTCEEENKKGKELKAQFQAADEACQQAHKHLNSLKKRFYDKNKFFHMYKKVATAAANFASGDDKVALQCLCANQVEIFMEEWNTNDEFRKNYTSMNRPSSLDETLRVSVSDSKFVSSDEMMDVKEKEKPTLEIDRNEDELRKEEIECKLKDRIWLEERKKMKKERLKAEKAQKRAELEAKKEAEQKEKAREKRLRKNKRKGRGSEGSIGTSSSTATSKNDDYIVKPKEVDETEKTNHKPQVMSSPIENRRRSHLWGKMVTAAVRFLYSF